MNIELIICNRSYKLECSEEQHEPIKQATSLLNTKLQELRINHPYLENERLVVLAALELCQEILVLNAKHQENAQVTKMVQRLTKEVERVLTPSGTVDELLIVPVLEP